jgi:hypothetical protein
MSTLNRSKILPQLLSTIIHTELPLEEILLKLSNTGRKTASIDQIIDLLASTGLSRENATALLWDKGLVHEPITKDRIEIVRGARRFWSLFAEARAQHAALVQAGRVSAYRGDWGFFTLAQLKNLLPGLIIPDHFFRREYLANYYDRSDDYFCLDVYTVNRLPLFRHPFWPPATSAGERKLLLRARYC